MINLSQIWFSNCQFSYLGLIEIRLSQLSDMILKSAEKVFHAHAILVNFQLGLSDNNEEQRLFSNSGKMV